MKKFTFLFVLMAFIAINLSAQTPTLKTSPAMDTNKEVAVTTDNNSGVIASIENSVRGESYILVQTDPPTGKIETLKGNGRTIEFSKLTFTHNEKRTYLVLKKDFTTIGHFKVKARQGLSSVE